MNSVNCNLDIYNNSQKHCLTMPKEFSKHINYLLLSIKQGLKDSTTMYHVPSQHPFYFVC